MLPELLCWIVLVRGHCSEMEISPARAGRRKIWRLRIDRPLDRRLMSASPRKQTTQWLLICGTPPLSSAPTPPKRTKWAPTRRCTVTVWCSGALCSVLVQPTVREPRASVGAAAAPAHCAPTPLAAGCFWSRSGTRPLTGRPRRVRILSLALYGP